MAEATPRFADPKLQVNPNAPVRHFMPETTDGDPIQRDRFGNRIFTSPFKSYFDRENQPTKASLLVSPEGEAFIKQHPGILSDIDRGLIALTTQYEPNSIDQPLQRIHLSKNRKMERFEGTNIGDQSLVFLLQVDQEKYVIKIKAPIRSEGYDISQPYINEMLQVQTLEQEQRCRLENAGIVIPTFLFTSGQVSCTKFEEGEYTNTDTLNNIIEKLSWEINKYCDQQLDDLWKDIIADVSEKNLIQRPDGTIVWIDPFYYFKT